ncbi:MAG: hypothetical protein AB8G11_05520 [Saprospiraceae bacterium]
MKHIFLLLTVISLAFGMVNCESEEAPKTLYEKLEREALKDGKEYNELFLGLYFGMTKDSFLLHCADLNKDTVLYQGIGGKVEHELKNGELKYPTRMNFYPDFHENKIFRIETKFIYNNWAPWNKDTHTPIMKERVKDLMMDWYGGNEFIRIPHPVDTLAYIKLDGNRRILLESNLAGTDMTATFTDLKVEKKIQAELKKRREEEFKGSETED